jgi:hypothetical protein
VGEFQLNAGRIDQPPVPGYGYASFSDPAYEQEAGSIAANDDRAAQLIICGTDDSW